MQEIADDAGINKAMLHYYYRNKDKLFDAVFEEAMDRIFPKVKELLAVELPLFQKIEYFVENYITILSENVYLPAFIINEINQNPEKLSQMLTGKKNLSPEVFIKQIGDASQMNLIIPIDPKQLIINMISMCIFPFLWKPILIKVFKLSSGGFNKFIEERKKEIPKFIIRAIKAKK